MGDYQITCINKPDRDSPHERITHIGNGLWRLTLDTAIGMIERREHTFYTLSSANALLSAFSGVTGRAEIRVVRPSLLVGVSRPYLRTSLDGTPNDNLLRLPECSLLTPVLASLP